MDYRLWSTLHIFAKPNHQVGFLIHRSNKLKTDTFWVTNMNYYSNTTKHMIIYMQQNEIGNLELPLRRTQTDAQSSCSN